MNKNENIFQGDIFPTRHFKEAFAQKKKCLNGIFRIREEETRTIYDRKIDYSI